MRGLGFETYSMCGLFAADSGNRLSPEPAGTGRGRTCLPDDSGFGFG